MWDSGSANTCADQYHTRGLCMPAPQRPLNPYIHPIPAPRAQPNSQAVHVSPVSRYGESSCTRMAASQLDCAAACCSATSCCASGPSVHWNNASSLPTQVSDLAGFAFKQRSYWRICGWHWLLMTSTRAELRFERRARVSSWCHSSAYGVAGTHCLDAQAFSCALSGAQSTSQVFACPSTHLPYVSSSGGDTAHGSKAAGCRRRARSVRACKTVLLDFLERDLHEVASLPRAIS